jgi:ubiquinone/menaquinone biosynthesis C-methylase UbiE
MTYRPPATGAVLLDYGCGSTAFLDQARERGWSTIGVDISERVLREVRERGHRALSADLSAWSSVPDSSITVARMNHVIEHVYRPREVLAAIVEKLESGGVLHVSTPNPASWTSALLRSRWLGLDCPRHVLLYPPPVLKSLLERVGFRKVDVFHEVLTKDAARSLGYVLHDLGRLPHEEILTMAERQGLAAALHAPAKLAARLRASDRIHAFAEK